MRRALLVLVLICMVTCLCAQKPNVKEKVIENAKGIRSYKFRITTSTFTKIENSTNVESHSLTVMVGEIDLVNRSLEMKVKVRRWGFGGNFNRSYEMIVLGNTAYINGTYGRMKEKVDENFWKRSDQIGQQIDLLKISEVEGIAKENVNGSELYVLKLKPDMNKFIEFVAEYSPNVNVTALKKYLKSVSVEEFVTEDYYPAGVRMKTVFEMPMTIRMGKLEGKAYIRKVVNTTVLLYDFNVPVKITPPKS